MLFRSKKEKLNIPLCKAYLDERELIAVKEVLDSGWLTHGNKNIEFEEMFRKIIGTKHAITLNSCTSALQLALQANNIKGEVILPSFTFVASANSVITAGAKPVFADVEFHSCNIDPQSIERMIGPDTEAVMPVHFAGQCCKMDEIIKMSRRHRLLIIEDSAETIGAVFRRRQAGSFGIGCFSLFPTKIITTGEGGVLTTDDDRLAEKVRMLLGHGILSRTENREKEEKPWFRQAVYAGYNYRMSNLLAAIGVEQLKKLDEILRLRREKAGFLSKLLDRNIFFLPNEENNSTHAYQMYTIKVKKGINRDIFVLRLRDKGIGASVHFDPPVHLQPFYLDRFKRDELKITQKLSSEIVTLPLYPGLSEEELFYIAETANKIAKDLKCSKKPLP